MGQFIEDLQYKIKTSSGSAALGTAKLLVGFILGNFFAIVGNQMTGFGDLAHIFVVIVCIATFFKIAKVWKWSHLAIFCLICVLLATVLQMYIQLAPGA